MELTAAPGEYALVRQHAQGKFYEATEKLITANDQKRPGGLFLANKSASSSALYWSPVWTSQIEPSRVLAMHMADINIKPDMVITTHPLPTDLSTGFVSTLTYTGMAGGQIKLSYREFNNGMARDAFTQEVALDYRPGELYVYKDARFVLHEASTTQITFTLVEPL